MFFLMSLCHSRH